MTENFNFYGQTTFVNRPTSTVIRDFQNQYGGAADPQLAQAYAQLAQLIELVLRSQQLPAPDKEEAVTAIHDAAGQLEDKSPDKSRLQTAFERIKGIVTKAADIAGPAVTLISSVVTLIGLF